MFTSTFSLSFQDNWLVSELSRTVLYLNSFDFDTHFYLVLFADHKIESAWTQDFNCERSSWRTSIPERQSLHCIALFIDQRDRTDTGDIPWSLLLMFKNARFQREKCSVSRLKDSLFVCSKEWCRKRCHPVRHECSWLAGDWRWWRLDRNKSEEKQRHWLEVN